MPYYGSALFVGFIAIERNLYQRVKQGATETALVAVFGLTLWYNAPLTQYSVHPQGLCSLRTVDVWMSLSSYAWQAVLSICPVYTGPQCFAFKVMPGMCQFVIFSLYNVAAPQMGISGILEGCQACKPLQSLATGVLLNSLERGLQCVPDFEGEMVLVDELLHTLL